MQGVYLLATAWLQCNFFTTEVTENTEESQERLSVGRFLNAGFAA